jgi:hypothetical protein
MRPHFDFHTVQIDVPKMVEKEVAAPKLVEKEVEIPKLVEREIEVPKLIERPVQAPKPPPTPAPGPLADQHMPQPQQLPPKTPDKQEQTFVNQPDYKSADVKGRIVRSFDGTLHFDNGSSFFIGKRGPDGKFIHDADGNGIRDPDWEDDSAPFVGDYGYCNGTDEDGFQCYAIHNDVVQRLIPKRTGTPA